MSQHPYRQIAESNKTAKAESKEPKINLGKTVE